MVDQSGGGTRGRTPPVLAVKRPARPCKSAMQTDLRRENQAMLRPRSRPGRARTASRPAAGASLALPLVGQASPTCGRAMHTDLSGPLSRKRSAFSSQTLPKGGPDNSKRIVGFGRIVASETGAPRDRICSRIWYEVDTRSHAATVRPSPARTASSAVPYWLIPSV
jgi:hypothetical protein